MIIAPIIASAQSLSANTAPYLLPGDNKATVDSTVGSQFWKFKTKPGPGSVTLDVTYGSMAVLGNPVAGTITLVVKLPNGKVGTTVIESHGQPVHYSFPAKFKKGGTYVIEVRPQENSLLRSGGEYTLRVAGDVDFSAAKPPGPNSIVGIYELNVCNYGSSDCEPVRFGKDGSVVGADGATGTWKVFDPDQLIYIITFKGHTFNEKLSPGRGLLSTDNDNIDFQSK